MIRSFVFFVVKMVSKSLYIVLNLQIRRHANGIILHVHTEKCYFSHLRKSIVITASEITKCVNLTYQCRTCTVGTIFKPLQFYCFTLVVYAADQGEGGAITG